MHVDKRTGLPVWGYNSSHLPASDLRHPETLARALEYSFNNEFLIEGKIDNVRIEVQLLLDAWGGTNIERMLHFMRT